MAKANQLRGQKLPKDVWDFLDSNIPNLIVKLLHGYINEVEKQNDIYAAEVVHYRSRLGHLEDRIDDLEDEVARLKKERVTTKPVNTVEGSKLKKERPAPKRKPWFTNVK